MNLPAWLLVLFTIVAGLCFLISSNIISELVTNAEKSSCFEPIPDIDDTSIEIFREIEVTILAVLYPLIGWLARMVIYGDGSSSKIYVSVKNSQSIVTVFSITLHTDMLMYYKYIFC